MSMISCQRCGGDGILPQYSWNKGGVCFTCGGDGKLNTFPPKRILSKSPSELKSYLAHSTTRDICEFQYFHKLGQEQQEIMKNELDERARKLGTYKAGLFKDKQEITLKSLEEREKSIPDTWKTHTAIARAGKVELVPVKWLMKFQGNLLRRDEDEMKEFAEKLQKEGLKEPVQIEIGQLNRKVGIGEGNHRTFAYDYLGLDYIPATVYRVQNAMSSLAKHYDKMSRVPKEEYFPASAKPSDVFDTYYDGDDLTIEPEYDPTNDGYDRLEDEGLKSHEEGNVFGVEKTDLDVSSVALKKDYGISGLYSNSYDDEIEDVIFLREIVKMMEHLRGSKTEIKKELLKEGVLKELNEERGLYALDLDKASSLHHKISGEYDEDMEDLFNPSTKTKSYDDDDDDDFDLDDLEEDKDDQIAKLMAELGF